MTSLIIYGAIVSVLCIAGLIDFVVQTRKEVNHVSKSDE